MGYLNNWVVWLIAIFIILVVLVVWIRATTTETQNNTSKSRTDHTTTDDTTPKHKLKPNRKSDDVIDDDSTDDSSDNLSDDSSDNYDDESDDEFMELAEGPGVSRVEHNYAVPMVGSRDLKEYSPNIQKRIVSYEGYRLDNDSNGKIQALQLSQHEPSALKNEIYNNVRKDLVIPNTNIIAKKSKKQSKGEIECKKVLDKIYNTDFQVQVRNLPWLKNPKTKRNLELDLYCPELKIACEYHGKQHYEVVKRFHRKGAVDLKYQQWKDNLKYELCNEAGVYLITVPYTVPLDKIEAFILYFLPERVQERRNIGQGTLTLTSRY
jgi:hypothetical protein